MVQQILGHTPLWVWAVLILLIARGLSAARPREGALGTFFILPLVMLVFGAQSVFGRFGSELLPWGAWLAGFLFGASLGWMSVPRTAVALAHKGIRLSGSYWPLALILGVFCVRYVGEVLRAMYPDMMQLPGGVVAMCLPSGLVSGLFVGRMLRIAALAGALRDDLPAVVAS
jgi:hypothetical protein